MDQVGSASVTQATEPLRERVLAFLQQRIGEIGQHTIISTKDIAKEFSVTPVTISKHLHSLADEGWIRAKPAGPKGTIISLEEGPKRTRRGRAKTQPQGGAPNRLKRVGNAYYCPWCGSKVEKAWRFCNRCGTRLPH